ncbi:hypothetical protein GW17_00005066 [Ensete ventricosum]|nr:hypothetical protein GW17_00005066 [Ensete ventricosum]
MLFNVPSDAIAGTNDRKTQGDQSRLIDRRHLRDAEVNKIAENPETDHAEDKPVSSEVRPKEVSEAVPVQNQAAAQKLLQKMSQPAHKEMHSRVQKHKFKAKQEEAAVFTLDEWERTKGMKSKPTVTGEKQDTSRANFQIFRQALDIQKLSRLGGVCLALLVLKRGRMMVEVSSEDGEEEEGGEKEDLVNLPFYNFTLLGQMVFVLIIFFASTVITTHQQFSRAM